jgi:hypothetical protein
MVTGGLVRASGLIVVMEAEQAREVIERFGLSPANVLVLGDLDSLPVESRAIPDPIRQPRDFYIDCYDRIDRCARELGRVLHRAARARAPMYGEKNVSSAVTAPQPG